MHLRRAIPVGLALLVAAAPGLCGNLTAASGTTPKSSTSSATSKAHPSTKKSRARRSRKERAQTAPTPQRISEIQQALAKDSSFTGSPSGKWDDSTVDAMKKFQTAHGLNPSGRLDGPTLQKLGLGSQTAGVAAPTPPLGSSSRLSRLTTPTTPSQTVQRQ
jgi:peptidoglycan hydrolase-like protein with peptidoglycan-binding domain